MLQNDVSDESINETIATESPQIDERLSTPLRLLFAFNGATEGFPTLALTAIVNDRIQMPLALLPAYYAFSFLPYSMKPIYAIASNAINIRPNVLLVTLLVSSAVAIFTTACLQQGQILGCFLIGFTRGVCVSWAEFLVGLSLISSARPLTGLENNDQPVDKLEQQEEHEKRLSCYQSQAATARNIGSLFAHFVTFGILLLQRYGHTDDNSSSGGIAISNSLVTVILVITSLFPLAASLVAIRYGVGRVDRMQSNPEEGFLTQSVSAAFFKGNMKHDFISILLFQSLLIIASLREIIIAFTNDLFFGIIAALLIISLILSILCSLGVSNRFHQSRRYHPTDTSAEANTQQGMGIMEHVTYIKYIAFYLILRHSAPSAGVMLSSYTYSIFRSEPLLLQSMSLVGSIMAALSSWAYGKKIAKKFYSLTGIKKVIAVTTIASALWSMFSILFVRLFRERSDNVFSGGLLLIGAYNVYQLIVSFLGELTFLPSVVLATTSIAHQEVTGSGSVRPQGTETEQQRSEAFVEDGNEVADSDNLDRLAPVRLDDGLQYGLLIACIDFGDQLSNFVAMPIVEMLDIRRDNEWKNLEWFIVVCSMLNVFSLVFLKMLRT